MTICDKCGEQYITDKYGVCPVCKGLGSGIPEKPRKTLKMLQNEVDDAQEKYDEPTFYGPLLLFVLGLFTLFIIIGGFLIGIAFLWQLCRWSEVPEKYKELAAAKRALRDYEP